MRRYVYILITVFFISSLQAGLYEVSLNTCEYERIIASEQAYYNYIPHYVKETIKKL